MSQLQKEAVKGVMDEREYQEMRKKRGDFKGFKDTVAEYLIVMHAYMNKAMMIWPSTEGDMPTLHQIRKITALGLACLEKNGCPPRILAGTDKAAVQQMVEDNAVQPPDFD